MAFERTTNIAHYQWLSTDVPDVVRIPTGSIGLQTDTGRRFRFDGAAWVEESHQGLSTDAAAAAGAVGSIHAKLRRLTDDVGNLRSQVNIITGSGISYAEKELVRRAVGETEDALGADIKMYLAMNEDSGTTIYDQYNRNLQFEADGPTLDQDGPAGKWISFDGVNDSLVQKAVPNLEHIVSTATQELQSPTAVAVQKLKAAATNPGFVRLRLIRKGAPDNNVKVEFRATKDGAAITNGTSNVFACANIATSAESPGFVFAIPPNLPKNAQYFIALLYDGNTNADADNNIGWLYDGAGGYGEGRHYYNGTGWTDIAGEDHEFGVWSDDLVFPDDFSIITVASSLHSALAFRHLCGSATMQSPWAQNMIRSHTGGYLSLAVRTVATSHEEGYYRYPPFDATALAITFSKAKSTGKIVGYFAGRPAITINGAASDGLARFSQPWVIGRGIQRNGSATTYWHGGIGPFIMTSSEVSAVNVSKVSQNLLIMRKYGRAV